MCIVLKDMFAWKVYLVQTCDLTNSLSTTVLDFISTLLFLQRISKISTLVGKELILQHFHIKGALKMLLIIQIDSSFSNIHFLKNNPL